MNNKTRKGPTSVIEDNYFLVSDKHFITQGHKKLWRYVEEVVNSDAFKEDIQNLRKIYKIPNDLVFPESEEEIHKLPQTSKELQLELPSEDEMRQVPPPEWVDFSNTTRVRMLMDDVDALCYKYGLPCFEFHDTFLDLVFYNIKPIKYQNDLSAFNLCTTQDIIEDKIEPWSNRKVESDDFAYPVAIRISPYASMRDIIDFVEKTYNPFIKELQDRHKMLDVEIGKQRIRDPKIVARNNYIYENRRKSRKMIMRLVGEKFDEFLDEGHISKIISHESQRRKHLQCT